MADPELTALPPLIAESLNRLLQAANGKRGVYLSLSSWQRIQDDARLQNLGQNERLALAAALMEHGQALINQASSDLFEAKKPYQEEVWPGKEDRQTMLAAQAAADRARNESIYCFEAAAKVVQRRYYDGDDGLLQEVSDRASEQANRLKYFYDGVIRDFSEPCPFRLDFETVITGLVALKVLGPFAEAFAKKLGELLAERTDRAIDRVHLTRRNRKPQVLKIKMAAGTATLALPEDLSDDAKLGILDVLDHDLNTLHGTPFHWNPETSKWEKDQPET